MLSLLDLLVRLKVFFPAHARLMSSRLQANEQKW